MTSPDSAPCSAAPGCLPASPSPTSGGSAAAVAAAVGRRSTLSPTLVAVLAISCGMAVANLYYAQPLLHAIAVDLRTGSGMAGLVVTASQIGFTVGLALVVPVGDMVVRRRLVPAVLLLTAAGLAGSALAPSIGVLIGMAFVVGLGSVAAQILVPFAATLADDERRGRVVGTVMSGLLLGILLARTLSGLVAGAAGWRAVYAAASGMVLLLAAVLARVLPVERARPRLAYGSLLASTVRVFATDATLRRRSLLGFLAFCQFSIFWTTAAFLLAGPPYHYSEGVIGLFGLVGAAGALCASFAGRLTDRGWTSRATVLFSGVGLISWGLLWLGHQRLLVLVVGIVLLDVAVQGTHVTNQGVIYRGAGESRSRANASYMVSYFAGGAAGSAAAASLYAVGGWSATCLLGGGVAAAAVIAPLLRPGGSSGGSTSGRRRRVSASVAPAAPGRSPA